MSNSMTVNGLSVQVHLPKAPEGDEIHSLPPCCIQTPNVVDEYECPSNWMNGSGKASSYFIPVTEGRHLWLNFNDLAKHTHDVAVVLSIQGINPITGQHTKELRLEQYQTNCPTHNIPFQQDKFCSACGYKWPAQNYMTTSSWPRGLFWIDGFRAENGTIRGFLITSETMKGVAAQLIGEDRVFAIGIAFYLSKESKPVKVPSYNPLRGAMSKNIGYAEPWGNLESANTKMLSYPSSGPSGSSVSRGLSRSLVVKSSCASPPSSSHSDENLNSFFSEEPTNGEFSVPKLEIAAGAKITQETCYTDSNPLSFYREEPHGLIYLNYATEGEVQKILQNGRKDRTAGGEGFLKPLTKGNPQSV